MESKKLSQQHGIMNRRTFLKLSGLLGLGMASTAILPAPAQCLKFDKRRYKLSQTRIAMGTFVSITLIHGSRDQAEQAVTRAYDEIDRVAGLLSRFDQRSAVARLNTEGFLRDVPPEMNQIIAHSLDYYHLSKGAFDITVKPVVDLFQEELGGEKKVFPSEQELHEVLALVGTRLIQVDRQAITFQKPGMGITLDGIAKGYIVDRAAEVLAQSGVANFLINAGGDIRTKGGRADKKPWTVAIQDPKKGMEYPDIFHMRDGAVATSGNYEVYFDREKMFHHIVDPKTGVSPDQSASVSVLAKTTTQADALSTSVFVMTPTQGIAFIDTIPNSACLIITKKGTLLRSSGWNYEAI